MNNRIRQIVKAQLLLMKHDPPVIVYVPMGQPHWKSVLVVPTSKLDEIKAKYGEDVKIF